MGALEPQWPAAAAAPWFPGTPAAGGPELNAPSIKTELVIKTEPEDDSYGDCCPRGKEEPPDPAACEWGWAHGGVRGRAVGSCSLRCLSVPLWAAAPCHPGDSDTLPRAILGTVTPHGCRAAPTPALPAASRGQNPTPGACGRAQGAPSAAPGALPSAPAGDAKPEVIVKVEPEEEAYIGCPQGPGDPGAAGEHCMAGTGCVWVRCCCWEPPHQGLEQLGRQRAGGAADLPRPQPGRNPQGQTPAPCLCQPRGHRSLCHPGGAPSCSPASAGSLGCVCFTGGGWTHPLGLPHSKKKNHNRSFEP
ncbi:Zinc finger protein 436-like protein [Aix galericulata]|nr:Zinc finger protein 436-like protein [Aix galericulata]